MNILGLFLQWLQGEKFSYEEILLASGLVKFAASFPNAKKTFTQLVDGTHKMEGANCNVGYDEIEAIETMLGAMGSTQANNASYRNLLRDFRRNCQVEYKGVADLYVRAGEIAIVDGSGNVCFRRNTGDTTVDWGDIDTGAEDTSKRYYVFACADAAATTFTVVISLSPTAPDGLTLFRRIGSFFNDGSDNITDVNDDQKLKYHATGSMEIWPTDTPPDGAVLCYGQAYNGTTDPTFADLFAVLANVYGGSDITDFEVPDLRGRVPLGKDNMGGASANRVTDADADTLGNADGAETVTLTAAQSGVPAHTHGAATRTGSGPAFVEFYGSPNSGGTVGTAVTNANSTASAASAHTNLQPFITLNYIMWK